ncbi:hypothetical protein A3B21_02545 [Candidatus Uhrbacteria bacterium RIFCSPLOWO2_01_FULL_47_24]|uniref:Type II secretion system protein GspI C-terminal domain-containing protein n=1 Tax=Candidatus Uhrbacteria bacterium RIFCSPLOWO2_01_FULL_47_24 TaxID=1802401 RepID=A0A1F7UP26_9BACT|nr:MAG: hypothetical protein A2753_02295 [Candidatus Uhrbacteria bacterium RIFCSPHIGHO2_01_FULL_47_11]OGL68284.1 MAG: hypothetical protein A3D58_04765 [Candidatus Uhrbacteria bacterium RIFCSPHIGHO2_02_FULL_46_47]OGL75696.1 MAG: hypothetical protein A3F52_01775 [Candidatus Uhrbacteria bacterium RIFCSPHIGHO2_12_FULL_47_11]OGL80022.1 MAG: hypothetical protein A3B21_02545 [Candidatus Uhrbacteria bacterium RIFCSPLOWO2_01_FULL_47_24]OGL85220.1 MAG: hypothetical protein A3J03_00135 [Candidatus Uhrbact
MSKLFSKNRPGISILEVIISLALISIIVLSVAELFPRGIITGKYGENLTIATNLAQGKIESLLADEYNAIGIGTVEPKSPVATDSSDPLSAFERETRIAYVDDNLNETMSDTGLKKIVVIIYIPSQFGEKSMTFSTLIAKK